MLGRLQDSTKKNTEEQARQMQTFKDTRNKETAELQQEVLGVKAEMAAVSSALKSLAEKNPEQAPEEPEELS
jgi:esterase/lipase